VLSFIYIENYHKEHLDLFVGIFFYPLKACNPFPFAFYFSTENNFLQDNRIGASPWLHSTKK
jgi:hypothetical protein